MFRTTEHIRFVPIKQLCFEKDSLLVLEFDRIFHDLFNGKGNSALFRDNKSVGYINAIAILLINGLLSLKRLEGF